MLYQTAINFDSKLEACQRDAGQPGIFVNAQEESTFDFTAVETIQQHLKARAYSLKMNVTLNREFFAAFEKARRTYIKTVGVRPYVGQMLGDLGQTPAEKCTFFLADEPEQPIAWANDPQQSLSAFLEEYFRPGFLYLKIIIPEYRMKRVFRPKCDIYDKDYELINLHI